MEIISKCDWGKDQGREESKQEKRKITHIYKTKCINAQKLKTFEARTCNGHTV